VKAGPEVVGMLEACSFLRERLDQENLDLGTVVMGAVAQLIKEGVLSAEEEDQVFAFWNHMAETVDEAGLDVLATGAIELFNDDAASQRLARAKLTGKARQILEDMRIGWGQPDYGAETVQ
jgi:hypothetical protein